MKKSINFILTFFIFFQSALISFADISQSDTQPKLTAEAGLLMDFDSKKVLYSKNAYEKHYPASTTKVMTALLTLENAKLTDVVTIKKDLGFVDGNGIALKVGESFTIEELLKFLLIHSANDVAVLLAQHIGGDVESFVDMMNAKVKELGGKNTHFNNPNGLPDDNHYSCAYDMALIAAKAMENEDFKKIVKTEKFKYDPTPQTPEMRYYRNTNRFLWSTKKIDYNGKKIPIKYNIVDGVKTGYTNAARNCLISSAKKNGIRFISVVLKAEGLNVYMDSRYLLDFGLNNFYSKKIISKNIILKEKSFLFSNNGKLKISSKEDFYAIRKKGEPDVSLESTKIILNKDLKLPLQKNEVVGKLEIFKDNEHIKTIDLIAKNSLISIFDDKNFISNAFKVFMILLGFIIIVTILILFIKISSKNKRSRRI